jgi:hypothetical protein
MEFFKGIEFAGGNFFHRFLLFNDFIRIIKSINTDKIMPLCVFLFRRFQINKQ